MCVLEIYKGARVVEVLGMGYELHFVCDFEDAFIWFEHSYISQEIYSINELVDTIHFIFARLHCNFGSLSFYSVPKTSFKSLYPTPLT